MVHDTWIRCTMDIICLPDTSRLCMYWLLYSAHTMPGDMAFALEYETMVKNQSEEP